MTPTIDQHTNPKATVSELAEKITNRIKPNYDPIKDRDNLGNVQKDIESLLTAFEQQVRQSERDGSLTQLTNDQKIILECLCEDERNRIAFAKEPNKKYYGSLLEIERLLTNPTKEVEK